MKQCQPKQPKQPYCPNILPTCKPEKRYDFGATRWSSTQQRILMKIWESPNTGVTIKKRSNSTRLPRPKRVVTCNVPTCSCCFNTTSFEVIFEEEVETKSDYLTIEICISNGMVFYCTRDTNKAGEYIHIMDCPCECEYGTQQRCNCIHTVKKLVELGINNDVCEDVEMV